MRIQKVEMVAVWLTPEEQNRINEHWLQHYFDIPKYVMHSELQDDESPDPYLLTPRVVKWLLKRLGEAKP